jgi:hypothetical protein
MTPISTPLVRGGLLGGIDFARSSLPTQVSAGGEPMHPVSATRQPAGQNDTAGPGKAHGVVVTLTSAGTRQPRAHEMAAWATHATTLASLLGCDFAGEYDPLGHHPGPVYFVPGDTLLSSEASALGIGGEDDLFGGIVPHPFVATKMITHPLVELDSHAPPGWSHAFARHVSPVVLPGFSAFTLADARRAGARLLGLGPA